MKNKLVTFNILENNQEIKGIISRIIKKENFPDLFVIQTNYGNYYRRQTELKFIS